MCRKKFSIYGVHIPRKCIEVIILTRDLVPISLKICFPQDGKGGGSYDLRYQNSVKKYEDDLEH